MDRGRHVVDGEQLALVAHLDRHGLGAEAVEDLLHDFLGQLDPAVFVLDLRRLSALALSTIETVRATATRSASQFRRKFAIDGT